MMRHTNEYQASWPKSSHWRKASCEEVDCIHYLFGWITVVPKDSDEDKYLEAVMNIFRCKRVADDLVISYHFEAGQPCFKGQAGAHKKKLERGPWLTRNQPGREAARLQRTAMEHDRWVDEFNEAPYRASRR